MLGFSALAQTSIAEVPDVEFISLTGVSATGEVGGLTTEITVYPTGVLGTTSLGSVLVTESVFVTGVSATGDVGSLYQAISSGSAFIMFF